MFSKVGATMVLWVIFFAPMAHAQNPLRLPQFKQQIFDVVEQALWNRSAIDTESTSVFQANVRLLDVDIDPRKKEIVLNFGQELLDYDLETELEQVLNHILDNIGNVTKGLKEVDYMILIEGVPLQEFFSESDREAQEQVSLESDVIQEDFEAFRQFEVAPQGVLSGKRVVISPGHGWYWNESCVCWKLQRDYFWGIVEDFVAAEITMYLNTELVSAGADVRPTRNMDKSTGIGETGHAKWEESAKYHIKALGAPSSVWNSGGTDRNKDIRSRPLYANWVNGNILVSIHTNGGGGTGTETWYDNANGHQINSQRLASILNDKVVSTIRQQYNSNWANRGVKSCNACKGENRLATRPAAIIEVAFHDTQTPDNDALHDKRFKQLVAQAIRKGIRKFVVSLAGETVRFLSLVEGKLNVPGDGVIVNSDGGQSDIDFELQPQFSLRGVTSGITISVFPFTTVPLQDLSLQTNFSVTGRPLTQCSIGASGPQMLAPPVNGVQGIARSFSQNDLNELVGSVRNNPGCEDVSLDQFLVFGVILHDQTHIPIPSFVRQLDALAIGIGENVFPTDNTPSAFNTSP
jgi:N-acetylmuramoyl-L-alanine amidase